MEGFSVTPEFLAAAASTIDAAVGGGEVGAPPTVAAGGAYGHPQLGAAVTEFGSAVQLASGVLVRKAQDASVGLRAGAQAYAQQEQHSAAALTEAGAGLGRPPGGG
ncbi:MAG TPA: hypothetical protein VNP03_16250 [Pseudonocardia sp.]|nr:hypothetical protein [Pseudonocardia sp.]